MARPPLPPVYIHVVARFAIDVTACWRPQRVGMSTVAIELSKALVRAAPDDRFVLLCSRERPAALEGLDCEAFFAASRNELMLKATWLPAMEPQIDCDAILYPYWPSPPFRREGAPPAVIFVHDLAFRLRAAEVPWQQRLYFGRVLPPALRQAAAVLVPSETTKRDLLSVYPMPRLADKVVVIPEGLPEAAAPGSLPEGIEPGFILAVGTVEPRKNYPRLLAAYRRLRGSHAVPQLVIAGRPGWAYGDTLRRIQGEPGVRYLGHVDEPTLESLYRSASVLAYPSLYEGFGLPLLEAMAHGVPAVVGKAGSLPELAQDAALAVDAEDPGAIAGALERLLADESLRTRLGAEGRRRASGYTWASAADRTLDVLHRVIDKSARRAA